MWYTSWEVRTNQGLISTSDNTCCREIISLSLKAARLVVSNIISLLPRCLTNSILKYKSCGFKTLRDLTIGSLIRYWNRAQASITTHIIHSKFVLHWKLTKYRSSMAVVCHTYVLRAKLQNFHPLQGVSWAKGICEISFKTDSERIVYIVTYMDNRNG